MNELIILSIIIPFYNSEAKCERLLARLQNSDFDDVEIIMIDDGSSDQTRTMLDEFSTSSNIRTKVISQDNRGPGGARNTGLAHAKGLYVWFVDSDDDILIDNAVTVLRSVNEHRYDIIDFDLMHNNKTLNSMELLAGSYNGEELKYNLFKKFGRIFTKLIRRQFLISNNLRYPEYCIYEDNPLALIIPLFAKSLLECSKYTYIHHTDFESVTRGAQNDRYYDRLWTANWGYIFAKKSLASEAIELHKIVDAYYIQLYLGNTVQLSRLPSASWIRKARVMKKFRSDTGHINFSYRWPKFENKMQALRFRLIWQMSYLLPSQTNYFENARKRAWARPFEAPHIPMPKMSD